MNIIVAGIRRSGNHAISMWLLNHLDGATCYYSNASTYHKSIVPTQLFYNNDEILLELAYHSNTSRPRDNRKTPFRVRNYDQNYKYCINSGNKLFGLENKSLKQIYKFTKDSSSDKIILILRDPINNIASLLKYKGVLLPLDKYHDLWMSYARSFDKDDIVIILYDKWFSDSGYRREIENKLGLNNTDNGLNFIHKAGGGSSFDMLNFQDNAQKMDVLKRWWEFRKDPRLFQTINHKDLLEMREKLFGPLHVNLRKRLRQYRKSIK